MKQDNFILNGNIGKHKSLWKPFTDPVTFFFFLSIQFHLAIPFLHERYSHALILQIILDSSRAPIYEPALELPNSFHFHTQVFPHSSSYSVTQPKKQVIGLRSGWTEPFGRVKNSFFYPFHLI